MVNKVNEPLGFGWVAFWDEARCELCNKEVPMVIEIGYVVDFVASHPNPTVSIVQS